MDYFWWKFGLHIFGGIMLLSVFAWNLRTKKKERKERDRFKHL